MIDGLDRGAEQVLGVQRLAFLGETPGVPQAPPAERVDNRAQVSAGWGQGVPDLSPAALAVGSDDPRAVKLAQPLAERLGSDTAEAVHQVGKPLGTGEQITYHQQAPPEEDVMYDPPGYLWAITIAGMITIPGATSVVLYAGARRADQGRPARCCSPPARPSCSAAGSSPAP